ncbi:hypothetical protein V501_02974 [Pseudogymnoascus sp. VKM F-4519 (FW-2642)]|nr:hypothetical protein V501_02974 [Pseudogymnoascus sp. VKM F-4519 (FW-2642)]
MVATRNGSSANPDDEPLYGRRCIVSTCNKPILQEDRSNEVCTSCKQAAMYATSKLKARRLKPKRSESGLWTPRSEVSSMSGSGNDTMRRRNFSPLTPTTGLNEECKKRKVNDSHSVGDEIENWRNHKSQKVGGVTEGNTESDFASQGSKAGTISHQTLDMSPDHMGSLNVSTDKDIRGTGIMPLEPMITRSRSIINSEAAKSTGINATELATPPSSNPSFKSTLPDIQIPHSKPSFSDGRIAPPEPQNGTHDSANNSFFPGDVLPVSEGLVLKSKGPLSVSEGSHIPEDFLLLSDDNLSLLEDPLLSDSPLSMLDGSPPPEDSPFLFGDTLVPEPSQHPVYIASTDSTNRSPENTYKSRDDQPTKPSSILESTSPFNTALRQPPKAPAILSDDRDFTHNGIVKFQSSVPFIGVCLDSIEPTLNPNSVQARRFNKPLGTESNSQGFYDVLSKYRGSDEEFVATTLFDMRTEDPSYISTQAKIAARGGKKRQFGEVCSRLDVDSTWSKHQNQPWKINPAVLGRDDLPLHKIFGEFDAKDMVPTVVEGELYLTQREEYEGPRRTWRYGDGGTGKEQGYPEAQAGAWRHLAKAAI